MQKLICFLIVLLIIGCDAHENDNRTKKSYYVPSSVNYKGQFRKGYIRKPVSAKASAIRNQARSKYYYKTKGKYRKKNKSK